MDLICTTSKMLYCSRSIKLGMCTHYVVHPYTQTGHIHCVNCFHAAGSLAANGFIEGLKVCAVPSGCKAYGEGKVASANALKGGSLYIGH